MSFDYFKNLGWSTNLYGEKVSVYQERCSQIQICLEVNGLKTSVWRHTLFGVEYYVVALNPESSDFYITIINRIASILNIPKDWIDFVNKDVYYIKEKEFNDKFFPHQQCTDFFDLYHSKSRFEFEETLKDLLNCDKVVYDFSSELLFIQCDCSESGDIISKLRDMGLNMDDFVYSLFNIDKYPLSVIIINMEEVIYGD